MRMNALFFITNINSYIHSQDGRSSLARSALAIDLTKLRLSLPYMSVNTIAFGLDRLMARWDASLENAFGVQD